MAPYGINLPSLSSLTAAQGGEAAASSGGITASGWRASLKPASFRGVAFSVDQDEIEGGRRAVTHEFPGRDMPYTEDLGRKAAACTVEGYVIGSDYMAKRDALIAACNAEGPGALIVPWMPERQVVCTGMRKRESAKEGGMARFSLTFAEAGQESAPSGAVLPGVLGMAQADASLAAAGAALDKSIVIAGVPVAVQAETLAGLQTLGGVLSGASGVAATAADLPGILSRLANITPSDLAGLLPSELAGPLFALSSSYSTLSSAYGVRTSRSSSSSAALTSRVSGLLAVAASAPVVTVAPAAGTMRRQAAQNLAALADYQRTAAVIEAARAVALVQPASRQEAATLRTQIVDAMDTALDASTDATVYASLTSLRTSTVRALAESAGAAPEVATVQSGSVLPALALAQRYVVSPGYGHDATAAEVEILARNRVRHPGFVPPGDLEVLRAV